MRDKDLATLEFNRILDKLQGFACTTFGKHLVCRLEPKNNHVDILQELDDTNDSVDIAYKKGIPPIDEFPDIYPLLEKIRIGMVLSLRELLKIRDILKISRTLKTYLQEDSKLFSEKNKAFNIALQLYVNKELENTLSTFIISEDEIADNASPVLFNIRRKIYSLKESIKNKLRDLLKSPRHQKLLQDSLVTLREGRYVIPIKQEYRHDIPGIIHDTSSTGSTVFIEPMVTVEINNKIKQLQVQEMV